MIRGQKTVTYNTLKFSLTRALQSKASKIPQIKNILFGYVFVHVCVFLKNANFVVKFQFTKISKSNKLACFNLLSSGNVN